MAPNYSCLLRFTLALVFYCCVTSYHTFSSLKQHWFTFTVSVGQKVSARGLTRLKWGHSGVIKDTVASTLLSLLDYAF